MSKDKQNGGIGSDSWDTQSGGVVRGPGIGGVSSSEVVCTHSLKTFSKLKK